jgi:hypothetical protein
MSINIFKIYGLQRTRTNYLQKFIDINYENVITLSNVTGWKHGFVQETIDWSGSNWEETPENARKHFDQNLLECKENKSEIIESFDNKRVNFLFCFRNPYDNFLTMQEHAPDKNKFHIRFVQDWNCKNRDYLSFIKNNKNTYAIRFEDFVNENKQKIFTDLKSKFSLKAKSKFYNDITNRIGPRLKVTERQFINEVFNEQQFTSEKLKQYFKNNLDFEVMSKLKYRIIE